jgi:hypothetical protein
MRASLAVREIGNRFQWQTSSTSLEIIVMLKLPILLSLALALLGWGFSANTVNAQAPLAASSTLVAPSDTNKIAEDYGKLPISFEANRGQGERGYRSTLNRRRDPVEHVNPQRLLLCRRIDRLDEVEHRLGTAECLFRILEHAERLSAARS